MKMKHGLNLAIAGAAALSASAAWASHGRGGAVVPQVDATGLLTFDLISYWDPTGISEPSSVFFTVTGPGGNANTSSTSKVSDFSDSRREEHIYGASTQLPGAGLYTISWSSCCTTGGIRNDGNGNFGSTSSIYWDGSTANNPILFDLENIQQEVARGQAYSDNLDAVAGPGLTLTYGDSTPNPTQGVSGITPPGYALDSTTGQITIDAASTAGYLDNSSNPSGGADYLFSGEIVAEDGSGQTQGSIEFFWLFDAVDQTGPANRAPTVSDIIVNAVVGDTVMEVVTATDPDGDTVILSLDNFIGTGVDISDLAFNPATGELVWDTTGFAPGTYIATIEGSDGFLTDIGSVRINLTSGPSSNVVPLPAGVWLILSGMAGFGAMRRFKSKKS